MKTSAFPILAVILAMTALTSCRDGSPENALQTHVTIYLAAPILKEGSAVITAGIPMPDDQWRSR